MFTTRNASSNTTTTVVQTRQRSLSSPHPSVAAPTASSKNKQQSKRTSASYCLPTRKTSKRQSLPPISKSLSTSNITAVSNSSSTSTSSAVTKHNSQQPQTIKVWLMSLLKISNPRATPIKVLSATSSPNIANSKPKSALPKIAKPPAVDQDSIVRSAAFLKLVDSHREFFKGCPELDSYLVNMAFVFLQRATPRIAPESLNTELLFFALYLAWESEEDSTVGIEGIIHYIIGPFPSSRNKDKMTRKYEILEWKRKLNVFHTGKDKLWKALDYNTYCDTPELLRVSKFFPADDAIFHRTRKAEELRGYF